MDAQPALSPGARVDDYRVESILGRGSFGITYLVTDVKLGLRLALKEYLPPGRLRREASGVLSVVAHGQRRAFRQGLDQFLAEGRVIAGLDHPNVVRVVRHFEALGTAYLAMSYYEGEPLHALLRRGGVFDAEEIRALALPLLDALEYLHDNGVTHRDIKPANVYVTREGRPILLDFGAARVVAAQGDALHRIGSEGYAAWEQFNTDQATGPWTDVYGLAATLYRLMTGDTPVASTQRRASLLNGEPDPLPPLTVAHGGAGAESLRRAITHGLEIEPGQRPQTASAWRTAFEGADPDPSLVARRGKDAETEWLPKLLAAAFVVLLLAALAWLLLGDPSPVPGEVPAPVVQAAPALAADADSWSQAVKADSAEAYRAYLDAFPQGINAADALEQLAFFDEEAWKTAEKSHSLAAYRDYLDAFPDGRYQVEARARADALQAVADSDDRAWAEARTARTAVAVDDYLATFPEGRHAAEARDLGAEIEREARDQQAFTAAQQIHRREAYQAYLDAFADGAYVAEALSALDELTLRPGKVFSDCPSCPRMVVVPPGSFQQGSGDDMPLARSNEQPLRTVRFATPFAMGVHEVTFEQWDACVAAGKCRSQAVDNGWGRGRRPVMMVTWHDARDYASWLSAVTGQNYDLPSESQWEYAARAGQAGDWIGGSASEVCTYANIAGAESGFPWRHTACADPFSAGTATVGYFSPNAFGVHDMIGNVAEWTRDCLNLSYLDAPTDGSAWSQGMCASRLTRGGSWFSGSEQLRLPARFNLKAGERNDFTGFRVVRRVEP